MLSQADAAITRRDPALPGLATLLDDERLLAALRIACPCCPIESLDARYTRYKPGTSCVVGFSVVVDGLRVAGYARTDSENRAAADMKPGASAVPTLVRGGRVALPDGATVISVFPNDRRMASLLETGEPERLDSLLKQLGPGAEHLRADARIEPLAYRPEHSFVGKLVSRNGQAVLKFPGDRNYKPMASRAERLGAGSVRVAALVGHSDRHRAEVFEWLDGRLLTEALHDPDFDVQTMCSVGAALADFHSHVRPGPIEPAPPMTREALQGHAVSIGALCPQLASLAQHVAGILGDALAHQPQFHRRLHGDFHPRQILIDGQSVAFLDLGEGLVGQPTVDLGLFLAHLEREAIRRRHRRSWVEPLASAFLNGYEAASEIPIRKWVPRALAMGLFRLAPRSFRHRQPDWATQMAALLERAQEVANENQAVA